METTIKFIGDNEGNDDSDDTEERQFICEICSVITKSKINLRKHKQRFHEDDRTYTCDNENCNKTITGLVKYRIHKKSHDASPCCYCGKVLSRKNIGRHMKACSMNQDIVLFYCVMCVYT